MTFEQGDRVETDHGPGTIAHEWREADTLVLGQWHAGRLFFIVALDAGYRRSFRPDELRPLPPRRQERF